MIIKLKKGGKPPANVVRITSAQSHPKNAAGGIHNVTLRVNRVVGAHVRSGSFQKGPVRAKKQPTRNKVGRV